MALYISQDLYLSGALDDGYRNANNPIIGYKNLLESGSIVASDEQADYPASNILNTSTGEYWLSPDNFFDQYLDMAIPPAAVNYVGIAGHNLAGAELQLQYRLDPGDAWTDATTAVIPGDNHALMWYFETINSAAYWRLNIQPAEGIAPRVAVIYIGEVLTLQRRVFVGHTPIKDAEQTNWQENMSQSSQYLGRVIESEVLDVSLAQQNVDQEFYREYIRPFAQAAKLKPFFMAWRPSKYPEEIGYCWITRNINMQNALPNGYVNFDIVGRALAPLPASVPTELTTT